ncbi:MAG: efflux transporter, family, subunit, partial [Akkermansiaceae bacterium]|nr:efflux transporter, family, subunit [Akkermansiaceae bacterium]
ISGLLHGHFSCPMSSPKPNLEDLRIDRSDLPAERSRFKTYLIVVVLLLLVGGGMWMSKQAKVPLVTTQVVKEKADTGPRVLLNASGYVNARRAATVSSKVTGKVVEIKVEEGMRVEEGQLLAKLDDSNSVASMRLAEAQLDSAKMLAAEIGPTLEYAEKQLARFTELATGNSVSKADIDRTRSEAAGQRAKLERLGADIKVAESQVAQWKQQVDDNVILAPFSGIVTSKNAQPGEMISPMSVGGFTRTGICTIVDMASLEIDVDVNESFINRVRAGQKVEATLDSYPDWRIPAKVIAIIPTADRQKATVKVRVGFDQLDPKILPDMAVKVAFLEDANAESAKPGVRLPKAAIHDDHGKSIVWVLDGDKVRRREVVIASTLDEEATLASGLKDGETIVTDATGGDLIEGGRVKLPARK